MTCRFLDPQQSASFLRSTLECRRLPFSELRSNPYNDCTRLTTLLRGLRDCMERTSRRILQRLLKSRCNFRIWRPLAWHLPQVASLALRGLYQNLDYALMLRRLILGASGGRGSFSKRSSVVALGREGL